MTTLGNTLGRKGNQRTGFLGDELGKCEGDEGGKCFSPDFSGLMKW